MANPIAGSVALTDGNTVFPGDSTGVGPGTLLADMVQPWSFGPTGSTTSGTLDAAVYLESAGTLDFYYQIANDSTSATSLVRLSNVDFTGFLSSVAFRTDGSTLSGTSFVDGTVAPTLADRLGGVIGFNFPLFVDEIAPGQTSNVLIISTDGTKFVAGNSGVIGGFGVITVAAFQPAPVPEPASIVLLGAGLLSLALTVRRRLLP